MSVSMIGEGPTADDLRLAALQSYGILDTPPDAAFDGIVRLATRLCRTPVGLISFVTAERQWFKARVNFPECETDLERSVCKFALGEPDLLVVPDLTRDPRTAANPLVTGAPFIRFYAGAPLRLSDGQVLGSLCVIDTVPRPEGLSPEQADDLRTLAAQVVTQLQMRRAVEQRDRTLELQSLELRQAQRLDVLARASAALLAADDPAAVLEPILTDGAKALGFDRAYLYDIAPDRRHLRLTHAVNVGPEARASLQRMPFGAPLCGIVAATEQPLIIAGLQRGREPDREAPRRMGLDAYAGFPVISRGELCAVIAFASTRMPAFDAEALAFFKTLARLMAAVYERLDGEAALAESRAYWRSLFERLCEGFIVGEVVRNGDGAISGWRFIELNRAAGDLLGVSVTAVVGRPVREVLPSIEDAWIDDLAEVVATGEPREFLRRVDSLDRWYEGRAFAIGADRFAVTFLEVTQRVHAEARRIALLQLGDRLRDLTVVSEMVRAAADIVGTTLGVTRAGFGRVDPAFEFVDIEDWTAPGIPSIAGRHRFADYGPISDDLRRGEPLVIADVRTDPRTRDAPQAMLDLGIVALVNMPVLDRGRTVAIFIVQDDKPHPWAVETLGFLRNVAERLEAGVARVRAEEDQRLLNEEISHRLKNTLAMVLSIATQTLRRVPDRAPVEAFERRIHALSTAHNVLLRQTWTTAPAHEVVESVVAAAGHGDRIAVAGPDLDLGPRATLSLSLLLHELATNAAKYGALSVPEGHVDVAWHIEGEGERRDLVFAWTERGGPPPVAPDQSRRAGFGSRLIRMGLAGSGGVDLRYPPSGFQATMRAPLVQLQQG